MANAENKVTAPTGHAAPDAAVAAGGFQDAAGPRLLRVGVFGRYELEFGGVVLDNAEVRSRRLKTLMGILALNHGKELYCEYIADSIWPSSPPVKQRNCFYNLWYRLMKSVLPPDANRNLYFSREQYSCSLLDDYVETDVEQVERACLDLSDPMITPASAIDAYQRLQRSYLGELLPGENENPIIVRARGEWRDRVADALARAADALRAAGEAPTALWLVKAACRVDMHREDLVRMRMRLLIDMGRPSAALMAYDEMLDNMMTQVGVAPSQQSTELVKEVVDTIPVDWRNAKCYQKKRRRRSGNSARANAKRLAADGRAPSKPAFRDPPPAQRLDSPAGVQRLELPLQDGIPTRAPASLQPDGQPGFGAFPS